MTPTRVLLPSGSPEPDAPWLQQAVEVLATGGLVIVPTETVYGITARADDPQALLNLARAKGAPGGRPWTWHVGSAAALGHCFESTRLDRIIARYWPGPLTLVLPGVPPGLELIAKDDWIGIRCTAGPFSAALCNAAPFPVVMTSANEHGGAPAVDHHSFDNLELASGDLILDGGPTRLQESSTILRMGAGRFELLREGLHDMNSLKRTAGQKIAFACTGNTCRSPMAEGIARAMLAKSIGCSEDALAEHGFVVSSMGIYAEPGSPAARHAVDTMREQGVDISAHSATQATAENVAELDAVYCLTRGHLGALQQLLPPGQREILQLLDPKGRDIADPIGGSAQVYLECAAQIAECIEARLKHWI